MALLGFKKRFAELVQEGIKTQTIRGNRKHPIKPGETLYLYYGLRTKHVLKLREAVCDAVHKIRITTKGITIDRKKITDMHMLNAFALLDGFSNWDEMTRWWKLTHGPKCFPFNGILITWNADTQPETRNL